MEASILEYLNKLKVDKSGSSLSFMQRFILDGMVKEKVDPELIF